MNSLSLKAIIKYAHIVILGLLRQPMAFAVHIIVAIICGLLILPNNSYGYATFTVLDKIIAYNKDAIPVITGSMFSMIYPLIGFLLIKLTVKKPIPENLLSSFPIQKRDIFFGSFLASFFILTMHLIFIALIGSVKNLPITSLHQIPYVISLCFIISFPSIVMTSTVVSIEEYCGLKDAKTRSILVVALWIAWISYMGVSLHGIGWDISGIKFPILKVFHQSNINIGFVSLKNKTEFIFDFNNFFLDKSYIYYQIIRSSLWLLILWLAGSKEFVLKINALPSFNSAIFQKKACGFKPVSFVLGYVDKGYNLRFLEIT